MREILFRGKTEQGEWVYGVYYKQDHYYDEKVEKHCIITSTDTLVNDIDLDFCDVIPETVEQYTGLTDKNGKKIFEGDIVKANFCTNGSKQTFLVIYNNGMFLFDNKSITVPKHEIYKVEVIGNIHDNKELLGE